MELQVGLKPPAMGQKDIDVLLARSVGEACRVDRGLALSRPEAGAVDLIAIGVQAEVDDMRPASGRGEGPQTVEGAAIGFVGDAVRAETPGLAIVADDLASDLQAEFIEPGSRRIEGVAQETEAAPVRGEIGLGVLWLGFTEARDQTIDARGAGLVDVLDKEAQRLPGGQGPFHRGIGGLGAIGAGQALAIRGLAITDRLSGQADAGRYRLAAGRQGEMPHGLGVVAAAAQAQPDRGGIVGDDRCELNDTPHGIGSEQGPGRAAHQVDEGDRIGIDQGQVLIGCIPEQGVVDPEPVHQVQHLGPLEASDDGNALPRRGLLHEYAGLTAKQIDRAGRELIVQRLPVDRRQGLGAGQFRGQAALADDADRIGSFNVCIGVCVCVCVGRGQGQAG